MSSVRLINEADFEDVFNGFKNNKIIGQFGSVYDQVLTTVGTAHEKNKKQRQAQEREIKNIRDQFDMIEQQTAKLKFEKQKCNEDLTNRKSDFLNLNKEQMVKLVENQKKLAIRTTKKIRCSDLQSKALAKGYGTDALGNVDNQEDGDRTKRKRRKVIVLRQNRGQSLDLTLQTSTELQNLGLTFQKWQVQSPVTSTQSSKRKKIILRRVDRQGEDSFENDPFA